MHLFVHVIFLATKILISLCDSNQYGSIFPSFCSSESLEKIECPNFSNNVENTLKSIKNIWSGTLVEISNCTIPATTLSNLSPSPLFKLTIANCGVEIVENGLFKYYYNLQELSLERNKLKEIPQIGKSVVVLNLKNNNISTVHSLDFKATPKLKTLYLSGNNITTLKQNAFITLNNTLENLYLDRNRLSSNEIENISQLSNVKKLNLSSNLIEELTPDTLKSFPSVKVLLLSNNMLRKLSYHTFIHNRKLNYLCLSENAIDSIEDDTFSSLSVLYTLDLSRNKLEQIPSFKNLQSLYRLILNENRIHIIKENDFSDLSNLEFLKIIANNLSVIEDGSFASLVKLKFLHIHNNAVREITKSTFKGLSSLVELTLDSFLFKNIEIDNFFDAKQLMVKFFEHDVFKVMLHF